MQPTTGFQPLSLHFSLQQHWVRVSDPCVVQNLCITPMPPRHNYKAKIADSHRDRHTNASPPQPMSHTLSLRQHPPWLPDRAPLTGEGAAQDVTIKTGAHCTANNSALGKSETDLSQATSWRRTAAVQYLFIGGNVYNQNLCCSDLCNSREKCIWPYLNLTQRAKSIEGHKIG